MKHIITTTLLLLALLLPTHAHNNQPGPPYEGVAKLHMTQL